MVREEILRKLYEMQDLKYKEFDSSLCPNVDNIIGVQVPKLRTIAKQLVKEEKKEYLELENIEYYEEKVIQGLMIGMSNLTIEDTKKYLERFIPKIDSWAVCDIVCSSLKLAKKYQKEIWEFLNNYIKSDKEFEIRFAVVMYLYYFLNEEYIDRIIENITEIKSDKYYVQMAMAWLLAECYIKQKEKAKEYLKNNKLDNFTHNKAIQKIIDSYRVSQQDKEFIRTLRRKAK